MRFLFILFIAAFLPGACAAQSTNALLKETSDAYRNARYLSADVSVYTFASSTAKGELLGKGMLRKSGTDYYSKFLNDELMINGSCTVVLDHQQKTVTWYDAEHAKKRNRKNEQQLPEIDSLYGKGDSVVYKGIENGLRHFLFYSKSPFSPVRLTEVYIDNQTHFINKIIYYYRINTAEEAFDMYKVEIDYTSISTLPPPQTYFSEKKYLDYNKGIPHLSAAYANYKLIIAK